MILSALLLNLAVAVTSPRPSISSPLAAGQTLRIRLDRPRQTIDNFGASDSWTIEPLIHWPEAQRRQIADLLFDREKGIGLSGWRHNLGGGINHESISMPLRTVDTYEVSKGVYDWNRIPGQRWMLRAARERGVRDLIAYAISPPRRLTRNGLTNGTENGGSTNLKSGAEGEFATYLVDVLSHYRAEGYDFRYISPINEPDFEWNEGSQEGSRASNDDILRIDHAVEQELKRRGLSVGLLSPEATSPQVGYTPNETMTKKYGRPYGNYADMLVRSPSWRPVYAYHAYWSDRLEEIVPYRKKLRAALDRVPNLRIWQTEYCQLQGPRGEGGWGRDLGMTLALNMARLIHFDLTIVEASSWSWWLAVSDADYKDGLIYVDDLGTTSGTIYPSKTLWALGNFSRFVRPGFQRVEVDGATEDASNLLVSAYASPDSHEVAIVLINPSTSSKTADLQLPGHWNAKPYVTSDRPGEDLKAKPAISLDHALVVPSRTVMTLVAKSIP